MGTEQTRLDLQAAYYRLATADELQLDTLVDRLRAAAAAVDAGCYPPPLISAWGRTPN